MVPRIIFVGRLYFHPKSSKIQIPRVFKAIFSQEKVGISSSRRFFVCKNAGCTLPQKKLSSAFKQNSTNIHVPMAEYNGQWEKHTHKQNPHSI